MCVCSTVSYFVLYIGVCHGDDVFSVLKTPWLSALTTLNDRNMQKHLIDMWISFATNG